VIPNPADEIVSDLERQWPDWQIWYVRRLYQGPVWCARRWDDTGSTINADSPEELGEELARKKD
jgi:hypothetical protein